MQAKPALTSRLLYKYDITNAPCLPCAVRLKVASGCCVAGDEAATVEVHILHSYSREEFCGSPLRVAIHGFIRPEIRFNGLQQLLARIKADIGIARSQLDEAAAMALKGHEIFQR